MSDDERLIRWHAVVHYRTENGAPEVEHDLEELGELHDLIELGPHWDTIQRKRCGRRPPPSRLPSALAVCETCIPHVIGAS
jgi:hypothetical protein